MQPFLLTFDVEEFDLPTEWGRALPMATQLEVMARGVTTIAALLDRHAMRATFFATGTVARTRPDLLRTLADAGHEVGVHGLAHQDDYGQLAAEAAIARLCEARALVEAATGRPALGIRTPHLRPCPAARLRAAGFCYDASPHPTWVPTRYNGLHWPRQPWREADLWRLPISVVPGLRMPVSFIWFRAAGVRAARLAAAAAACRAPYLHMYFHPWEAVEVGAHGAPAWIALRTGPRFVAALDAFLSWTARRFRGCTAGGFCDELAA